MSSIFDILLHGAQGVAHAWSLPNIRGQGQERWIGTKDHGRLEKFCKKHDKQDYGVFFCVSTIAGGQPRKKENAVALPFLFVDIDFKDHDETPEEIEDTLKTLPLRPSRLHHTGNGIHSYWYLDTPILADGMDAAEILLRRLANALGGDPQVAHRVALMRVPGSHNSKRGAWLPVRVILETTASYTPGQIDAWVSSLSDPILVRRGRETNPFLRVAAEQAYRAPVDVAQRLRDMRVGGEGDAGVHATQLSCTASMVANDMEEDEIVRLVLDATQALEGTDGWNWRDEERTIRNMCSDFEKKLERRPRDITRALRPLVQEKPTGPPPENVVSLSDARKEREARSEEKSEKLSTKKKNEHVVLGKGILAALADEGRKLLYADNQCWMYQGGVWRAMDADTERSWASRMVEEGCNAMRLVSNTKIVNETRAWLQRQPDIHREHVDWDGHGLIATQSGTVDWEDGTVEALLPEDYATRIIECRYEPEATCPVWQNMLVGDYGFDPPTISFLQEFAGTCLVSSKPRGLMRALVLQGPSNTGKSNLLNTIAGLISKEHNSTPLVALEGTHGLMSFLKPYPWVLHEAFEQSRWEMSANTKALLSGDAVHVNVKNGPMIPLVFKHPILWGTNVPPQFKEASRAMENRLAIVKMRRAFNPLQIVGTALQAQRQGYRTPAELVLDTEAPGLLNWAIEGLKRAMVRGHFEFTDEMMEALHEMRAASNMATGFMSECVEYSPDHYVSIADFYGAFTVWWRDHRGGIAPSVDSLGRAMGSLSDPRVVTGHRVNRKRVTAGIMLNDEGLDCWNAYSSSVAAERSGLRISERSEDVNHVLGPDQMHGSVIQAMRHAHRTWMPDTDT
jgi:P4 family phage/plasmid primase-like protien